MERDAYGDVSVRAPGDRRRPPAVEDHARSAARNAAYAREVSAQPGRAERRPASGRRAAARSSRPEAGGMDRSRNEPPGEVDYFATDRSPGEHADPDHPR